MNGLKRPNEVEVSKTGHRAMAVVAVVYVPLAMAENVAQEPRSTAWADYGIGSAAKGEYIDVFDYSTKPNVIQAVKRSHRAKQVVDSIQ